MHILHVTPYYSPAYAFGGVVSAVEGLSQALLRQGHQVSVLTTDALTQTTRIRELKPENREGIHVYRARNLSIQLRGRFNLSTPFSMRKLANELIPQVDVVHCHEFRTVENLLITPIAEKYQIPLILSPHGTLTHTTGRSQLKAGWDKFLSPSVAQRFQHVVALTQNELMDVQQLWEQFQVQNTHFHVIPNGINLSTYKNLPDGETFREKYGLQDKTVFLFMGRLHARKGIDLVVKAFQQLEDDNVHLLIVGPDEGMLSVIESFLDNRMTITGYLSGEERLSALAVTDVFLLPAIGEGLSMSVLEAMGAGIPVIISPGCNLPVVAEYEAGLIVEREIGAIFQAMYDLFHNIDKRSAMAENAKKLIENRFTWDLVAKQFGNVYQSISSSGKFMLS